MLDSGTTTSYVARYLTKLKNLTVIINSTDIANVLLPPSGNHFYIAGGEVRQDDGAIFGQSAVEQVRNFNVNWAIISVGGIDNQLNLTDYYPLESEFSRALIEQAQEVVVVADRSKFGRVGLAKICKMDEIDILITNPHIPKGIARKIHSMNVKLITDFTHIE